MSILFQDAGLRTDPEPPAPRRRPRWRFVVLFAVLLGLVGTSAAVGAHLLWSPRAEDPAPPQVLCWDGVHRARADCGLPTGANGLRWVFPSLKPHSPRCERVRYDDDSVDRPLEFACFTWLKGTRVDLTYSRRIATNRSQTFLARVYRGTEPEASHDGERLTYRPERPREGRYELTAMYARFPFSVTVRAATAELRDLAYTSLVRWRPVRQIAVRPEQSLERSPLRPRR